MVIGRGLVAKNFEPYNKNDNFLIFASGVSDSKSTVQAEYDRETALLQQVASENKEKTLVYFSTCSLYDPFENTSVYAKHKIKTEQYIKDNAVSYLIIRASNLVGRSHNPNTIFNFMTHNIENDIHFSLWVNATRNLIGIDDFFAIANRILQEHTIINRIVNIANPQNYLVKDIASGIEKYYNKKAHYTEVERGIDFPIDVTDMLPVALQLGLQFGDSYLQDLLKKYY